MSEKKNGMQNERWNDIDGSASGEILEAFLDSESDGYAILQLKSTEENRDRSFESYDSFERHGLQPDINFYDTMYTGPITTQSPNTDVICENLFVKFNTDRPENFKGHSLSVSDVIALKLQETVKYYYVDSFGFKELPGFNSGKNPIRNIEDQIEQNDNQLDGMINNLPEETIAEKEAKSSVIEKLKAPLPGQERKSRSACFELELP